MDEYPENHVYFPYCEEIVEFEDDTAWKLTVKYVDYLTRWGSTSPPPKEVYSAEEWLTKFHTEKETSYDPNMDLLVEDIQNFLMELPDSVSNLEVGFDETAENMRYSIIEKLEMLIAEDDDITELVARNRAELAKV